MDPFAAIGFASSILTFLDFGFKIVTMVNQIHVSALGASSSNANLEDLTNRMKALTLNFKPSKNRSDMSIVERPFWMICTKCEDLSANLLKILDDVKPKTPGSKRSSLAATFRAFMNASRLKELESKLQDYWSIMQIQLGKMTQLV